MVIPSWVIVTWAAWVVTGVYFIATAFGTQRISAREPIAKRLKDNFFLLGGYILLFAQGRPGSAWTTPFVPPGWEVRVGVAGAVLTVAGLGFTCWARKTLGRYWSRIVAVKQDHKLVTTGPYRWVRHPLYTGLLAGTLGAALAFGMWHALAGVVLLWIGFISRAHREDAVMGGQFGEEFAAYRARTGRLVPWA